MQHLLLLHGAIGSEKQLLPLADLLKDDYHVNTLNFEGHGGRAGDEVFSFEHFVANIHAFLAENQIEKCVLFGYSMGGYAALWFAKLYPEKVERVITLATKFAWSPEIAAKEIAQLDPDKIAEKVPKFAAALHTLHAPLDWKTVLYKTADLLRGLGAGNALQESDFQQISQPVLLCLGAEDTMVTQEETEKVAHLLQNTEVCILEGVPHMLERADPAQIVAVIRKAIELN